MNCLQLKTKSNEVKKEYIKSFFINKSKVDQKLTILKSFIDEYVELDFFYKFDVSETNTKEQFECVFYFKNGISIYQVIVPYEIVNDEYYQDNELISISDVNSNFFSLQDENLIIDHKDYNPKKVMVKYNIENYIKSETEDYRKGCDHMDSLKGGRDYEI